MTLGLGFGVGVGGPYIYTQANPQPDPQPQTIYHPLSKINKGIFSHISVYIIGVFFNKDFLYIEKNPY